MKRHSLGVIPFRPYRLSRLTLPLTSISELKAAQVSVLPEFESVQPFRRERWAELAAFQPRILVGYGFDLQRLTDKVKAEEIELPSVDRAIAALTDCGSSPISDALRDRLWNTFGVPVYELIVAPGCRLLACECEGSRRVACAGGRPGLFGQRRTRLRCAAASLCVHRLYRRYRNTAL